MVRDGVVIVHFVRPEGGQGIVQLQWEDDWWTGGFHMSREDVGLFICFVARGNH